MRVVPLLSLSLFFLGSSFFFVLSVLVFRFVLPVLPSIVLCSSLYLIYYFFFLLTYCLFSSYTVISPSVLLVIVLSGIREE